MLNLLVGTSRTATIPLPPFQAAPPSSGQLGTRLEVNSRVEIQLSRSFPPPPSPGVTIYRYTAPHTVIRNNDNINKGIVPTNSKPIQRTPETPRAVLVLSQAPPMRLPADRLPEVVYPPSLRRKPAQVVTQSTQPVLADAPVLHLNSAGSLTTLLAGGNRGCLVERQTRQ